MEFGVRKFSEFADWAWKRFTISLGYTKVQTKERTASFAARPPFLLHNI
jgi:hypothetical protein